MLDKTFDPASVEKRLYQLWEKAGAFAADPASAVGRLTARDLSLPVEFYDMEAYYRAVRNRWVGWGDLSERTAAGGN